MKRFLIPALALTLIIVGCGTETVETVSVAPPTMGWSSWNAYMIDISDSIIMHQADLIVDKGLKDAGYEFVNVDDGYFGYRDENGTLVTHPTRFPNGIKHVSDHIHSLGLKAGIYSDAGDNTCGSSYNHDPNGFGVCLYGHDAQDMNLFFNDWDFDFIKIDYCGGSHLKLDEQERYTRIREVMDSVTKKHVVLNVCRWDYPGTWVKDISDSWRISGDIRPVWSSVKYIVDKNMYLSAYAGDGHYNDMDMLAVGYNEHPSPFWEDGLGLSYLEEEAHFGMWCIMSSPLLLGCNLDFIPEETLRIITNPELIAVNQDPLGLQAYVVQHVGEGYVFVKDLCVKRGPKRAVALYNPSDADCHFSVPASVLGFDGAIAVRDLNAREDLGSFDVIDLVLPPHCAKILCIEGGKRTEPSLYEAEWAYCPDFTAIRGTGAKYVPADNASGRAYVMNLGGSTSNRLVWNDVYSCNGGSYDITVSMFADESGDAVLDVNGKEYGFHYDAGSPSRTAVKIELWKGENVIQLHAADALPPVDCISLAK